MASLDLMAQPDGEWVALSAGSPTGPPGTAFTVLLVQLNAGGGFAGHADWRLPTLGELQGLVDYADTFPPVVNAAFDTGCTGSCTITTCSCTELFRHWTSTTLPPTIGAGFAWIVDFNIGELTYDTKDTYYSARAVRP